MIETNIMSADVYLWIIVTATEIDAIFKNGCMVSLVLPLQYQPWKKPHEGNMRN